MQNWKLWSEVLHSTNVDASISNLLCYSIFSRFSPALKPIEMVPSNASYWAKELSSSILEQINLNIVAPVKIQISWCMIHQATIRIKTFFKFEYYFLYICITALRPRRRVIQQFLSSYNDKVDYFLFPPLPLPIDMRNLYIITMYTTIRRRLLFG